MVESRRDETQRVVTLRAIIARLDMPRGLSRRGLPVMTRHANSNGLVVDHLDRRKRARDVAGRAVAGGCRVGLGLAGCDRTVVAGAALGRSVVELSTRMTRFARHGRVPSRQRKIGGEMVEENSRLLGAGGKQHERRRRNEEHGRNDCPSGQSPKS